MKKQTCQEEGLFTEICSFLFVFSDWCPRSMFPIEVLFEEQILEPPRAPELVFNLKPQW